MKQIILMRHAKAEKGNLQKSDFERNLTDSGISAAKIIGAEMNKLQIIPKLIFCSSAARTRQTAENLLSKLDKKIEIIFKDELYFGELDNTVKQIKALNKDINSIMIIGHNPLIQELFKYFDFQSSDVVFKTANLGILDCEIATWNQLSPHICKISNFIDHRKL